MENISRRRLLRNSLLAGSPIAGLALESVIRPAAAQTTGGQQTYAETTPAETFDGVIGRTSADSTPSQLSIPSAPEDAPNIIYIVLDDTGFSDLHCYGSEVPTPNIDALAAGGLLYSNFHCKAICSPSRASLLTGCNNHSVGMRDLAGRDSGYPHSRGRVTPAAATVAQILQANGYSTMGVGKWHLTPDMSEGGARTHWPLQKGFDRWYGFLSGWTDQYNPNLIEDNHSIDPPDKPDYHFSVDIIDQAIKMLDSRSGGRRGATAGARAGTGARTGAGGFAEAGARTGAGERIGAGERAGARAGFGAGGGGAANRPFFLYVSFGALHAPVQVPKQYIDKYIPTYMKGWDQIREERYKRQLEMGVIPEGTELPERNPGDPAWEDLTDMQRTVYARYMAAYAGFAEHTDEQVGRLLNYLKEQNLFEDTLIVLVSDNGGAPEAGVSGSFERPYGGRMTLEEQYARLDDLGSENSQPLYQRPWAMASNTPFKYYKLWPHRGGVNTPMIVSWPNGIQSRGVRRQFVDIIDITPTILDVVGIQAPEVFNGVPQMPIQGKSAKATFDNANAPDPRDVQYFELRGNRAIRAGDWVAIAVHEGGNDFESDQWELYNVANDFSQANDLASQNPAKVEELKKLWWSEAEKYGALPLLGWGGMGGRGGGGGAGGMGARGAFDPNAIGSAGGGRIGAGRAGQATRGVPPAQQQ